MSYGLSPRYSGRGKLRAGQPTRTTSGQYVRDAARRQMAGEQQAPVSARQQMSDTVFR